MGVRSLFAFLRSTKLLASVPSISSYQGNLFRYTGIQPFNTEVAPDQVRLFRFGQIARVESLLDPFRVAFGEPPFLDEAVHSFTEQVRISSPASIQLDDSPSIERRLVPYFTACSGTGTACEVNGVRNINIRGTHATAAVP